LASFQGQGSLIDNCFIEEVIFNGGIKELTLALYNTEFVLTQVGTKCIKMTPKS